MSRRWTASIEAALADAGAELADVDAIAATAGPGLVGGLIVGLMTAKAIAAAAGKPLLAINHLEGHALTARLTDGLAFPYLLLLVSGGHTQIVLVRGVGDYQRWATTIDDALGEAFDKTAKLLGLPYPGGPDVERAARDGRSRALRLSAADEGRGAARFLLLRPEDGGAAGGDRDRAAVASRTSPTSAPPSRRRSPTRWPTASAAAWPASATNFRESPSRRWWWPAASPPTRRSARRCETLCAAARLPLRRAAAGALHRQCRDDRLGRHRAAARRPGRRRRRSISCRARAGRSTRCRAPLVGSGRRGAKA